MDLKYLQTFQTIWEEGSFSKAAEKLNYTQSTITFQMQQLERALSAQLFEKIGRRMLPTEAGRQLVPYVRAVLESVEKMRGFGDELTLLRGELRVGAAETQLCYRLPPLLKQFHARAPQAQLRLHSMNCCDIRDALLAGTIDLGIFYEEVGGFGASLQTVAMGRFELALLASPETKRQFSDFITPNRRLATALIAGEPSCIFRQSIENDLRHRQIVLAHTMELRSIPTVKHLVENDVGVAYLPLFTARAELESGALCQIDTAPTRRSVSAVCGYHKNKWLSPLAQLFLELVSHANNFGAAS